MIRFSSLFYFICIFIHCYVQISGPSISPLKRWNISRPPGVLLTGNHISLLPFLNSFPGPPVSRLIGKLRTKRYLIGFHIIIKHLRQLLSLTLNFFCHCNPIAAVQLSSGSSYGVCIRAYVWDCRKDTSTRIRSTHLCFSTNSHTQSPSHRPPFMPTSTHSISWTSNQSPTDADELQPSLLGDNHSPSSTPLVLLHRFDRRTTSSIFPSFSSVFYVNTDVQDLTHCVWAQMAPVAARQSELLQEDRSPLDSTSMYVCVFVLAMCSCLCFMCLYVSMLYGDNDKDKWCCVEHINLVHMLGIQNANELCFISFRSRVKPQVRECVKTWFIRK